MSAQSQIKLIVGLGNPGDEYKKTRHNAGFEVIDKLLENLPGSFKKGDGFCGIYWEGRFKGNNLFIQKPLTFMNISGRAVASIAKRYQILPKEILLVFDDVDLALGKLRIRKNGSSAGHNGVESVIEELGSSGFPRLRVGIGRSEARSQADYVLSKFAEDEKELFSKVSKLAADAIKLILSRGIQCAMNEYNGMSLEEETIDKETK
jgi:PTH1 family peptidyl-tRNA hydrolase